MCLLVCVLLTVVFSYSWYRCFVFKILNCVEHDGLGLLDVNVQCVAVCCSVLQCVAVRCSVLQCVAVCCSALQCVQCVAMCCSVSRLHTAAKSPSLSRSRSRSHFRSVSLPYPSPSLPQSTSLAPSLLPSFHSLSSLPVYLAFFIHVYLRGTLQRHPHR